ncbi:TIGR01621 family pseudouridine synthase [Pseudoalteromonas luteoviolacea]|uniref:RNA pseudouridine synthase n=1 Tax=Pseudoalteromonas luteoviolacea H33 TaxID=1365251 RepID=A0A161Y8H6_9GAMM|nr:TIGR01621 family pseudouridine synthase [Pseudoalteromonas luteoviolacea]KZN52240.1 RNA pseudouridine synthase [Pseudoalteromonas luteoviolacea H33]KZN77125.1 RNA pseudouridine synthase [Pseudoalteromonas luteoviolacea H33-S]MBQ4877301.1 TIGR01621 family pseudouridine synthase [Pseudoalteromonas luteoviolacea]MBQ4906162.1 TIGR01621 family pseudouridine synthase [Pseudoalteromonas luteoviolacea]
MADIKVIAQHEDFVVAYKPCGLSFHSEEQTGFVALLEQQLEISLFPVHRLDKVTSGLLVLAKSSQAAAKLTELFTSREVDKYYLALISDKPKKKQGWIKGDMAKSRRGTYKLLKSQENPAITRFYSTSIEPGLRACLLKPYSGKTHQLRVALKSLSAPILGDDSYGGKQSDRVYLHAYYLSFNWNDERVAFSIEPEEGSKFMQLIEHEVFLSWRQPEQLEW